MPPASARVRMSVTMKSEGISKVSMRIFSPFWTAHEWRAMTSASFRYRGSSNAGSFPDGSSGSGVSPLKRERSDLATDFPCPEDIMRPIHAARTVATDQNTHEEPNHEEDA